MVYLLGGDGMVRIYSFEFVNNVKKIIRTMDKRALAFIGKD